MGGVGHFARQHWLSYKEAQRILQKDLSNTLHKPRRLGRFATLPVLVFAIDDQWVADLVEVQFVVNCCLLKKFVVLWPSTTRETDTS